METKQIELLETYLSLYINHAELLEQMKKETSPYVVLDVRNAPEEVKKEQVKGATALPARELESRINELDKEKIYIVYDWTAGTIFRETSIVASFESRF